MLYLATEAFCIPKEVFIMKNKSTFIPSLLVFLAGSLWGSMGLWVHRLHDLGCDSMDIVALRGIITAAVMAVVLLIRDPRAFRIRLQDFWVFLGTGIASVIFFNVCYFNAILETSMSVAAVLLYTAPAFVMVLSLLLFHEPLGVRKLLALGCALVGCLFVSGVIEEGSPLSTTGILFGVGAGLGYALYSIFSRFAIQKGYSTLTITFYTFLLAGLGSFPLTNVPHALQLSFSSVTGAVFTLLFVLVSTVFPYLLYTRGLEGLENGRASIIASIEPVMATVLGFIAFSEVPSPFGFVGMVLVLGGIIISSK